MTHEQRAERRRSVAEDIRTGYSVRAVMSRYKVSLSTVREACLGRGVKLPKDLDAGKEYRAEKQP